MYTKLQTRILLFTLCLSSLFANTSMAQTWTLMDSTFQQSLKAFDFYDDNTGIVSRGYVTNTTSNGGSSWGADVVTSSAIYGVKYTGPTTVFRGQDNGTIWKSTDGGTTWTQIGGYISDDIRALDFNGSTGIAADNDNMIDWSNDGGSTWTKVPNNMLGGGIGRLDRIQIPTTSVAYVAGDLGNRIWKSTDAGHTWTQITSIASTFSIIGMSFANAQTGFISGYDNSNANKLYKTTDGGVSWTDISAGLPYPLGAVFGVSANLIYAGADNKIYKSIDGGTTWTIDFTHPTTQISVIAFDKASNALYAMYGNGGTHKKFVKLANAFTGINESEMHNAIGIYPNPGNGKFNINATGIVNSVEIYNLCGEKVLEKCNSNTFDISHFSTGIYFAKIYDGAKIYNQKIVVQ